MRYADFNGFWIAMQERIGMAKARSLFLFRTIFSITCSPISYFNWNAERPRGGGAILPSDQSKGEAGGAGRGDQARGHPMFMGGVGGIISWHAGGDSAPLSLAFPPFGKRTF